MPLSFPHGDRGVVVLPAHALLREPLMLDLLRGRGTEVLFRANMRDFRRDRRFMPLAETLGLVRYWQSGHVLPDFCSDIDLAYDCAAEFPHMHPAQSAK
jgi:hypothetical protein